MIKNVKEKMNKVNQAWIDKDIVTWINVKDSLGFYSKDLGSECPEFLKDMSYWNTRYTHEETQDKHYKDWNPYCCSNKPCKSSAFDRMYKTDYGWECEYCKTKIGKHLYRIDTELYDKVKNHQLECINGSISILESKG